MTNEADGKEYLPKPVNLNPHELYTGERAVYEQGLQARRGSREPILYGIDINGVCYATDGNHRAFNALIHNEPLFGQLVGRTNLDVKNDPDFRPISALEVIPIEK